MKISNIKGDQVHSIITQIIYNVIHHIRRLKKEKIILISTDETTLIHVKQKLSKLGIKGYFPNPHEMLYLVMKHWKNAFKI